MRATATYTYNGTLGNTTASHRNATKTFRVSYSTKAYCHAVTLGSAVTRAVLSFRHTTVQSIGHSLIVYHYGNITIRVGTRFFVVSERDIYWHGVTTRLSVSTFYDDDYRPHRV